MIRDGTERIHDGGAEARGRRRRERAELERAQADQRDTERHLPDRDRSLRGRLRRFAER